MNQRIFFSALVCFMLFGVPFVFPETRALPVETKAAQPPLVNTQTLMDQADRLYAERTDLAQAKAAMDMYEKVVEAAPQFTEAYWKISRVAWWLGDQADPKEKTALFQKGIDRAKAALNQDNNSVEAHFWLGVNYGSYGEVRGILKSLFLIKPIRQEMETVIKLDPTYGGGGGYRLLGVVDYKVPGIAGGSNKRALENLRKAQAIAPNNPFNIYYMAEYYFNDGTKSKAKSELHRLEDLKVDQEDMPDLLLMQAKGRQLREKIK